jgi:2-haloacid dehalogenase
VIEKFMPSPTTLVFDIGNVLVSWDPRNLYSKVFDDPARMEWFLAEVCHNAWNLEQDRGRLFAEAVAERTAAFPHLEAEIRAYDERWPEMISGPIEGSVKLLEALRGRGDRVYAITNFSHEKFAVAQDLFPFLRGFDGIVVSGDERVIKPDPAIYRLLLDRYALAAQDCVFVDDSRANVEGALAVGMQAIHFTSPEAMIRDLQAMGFPVPEVG